MSTFLGFFIYMFGGPFFKSVNGLIKEKVTHFVYFNTPCLPTLLKKVVHSLYGMFAVQIDRKFTKLHIVKNKCYIILVKSH